MTSGRVIGLWVAVLGLGAWPGLGRAQEPAAGDLAKSYRFQELYTTEPPEKAPPGAIGQYQVAYKITISRDEDGAGGGKGSSEEHVYQMRYSERPAQLNPADDRMILALVRRYEAVRLVSSFGRYPDVEAMAGLTVWSQVQANSAANQLISLVPGRQITERQYIYGGSQPSVAKMALALPDQPIRIGETWQVDRLGATELVDKEIVDGVLTGKLKAVRPESKGAGQVAVFEVSGRVTTAKQSDLAHRAEIEFAFTPGKAADEAMVEAHGGIVRLSLAEVEVVEGVPGESPRRTLRRSFILERRIPGTGPALAIPEPPPTPTPENSWLLFNLDKDKRFQFLHPQDLRVLDPERLPQDVVVLVTDQPEDPSTLNLRFFPKAEARPEVVLRRLSDDARAKGATLGNEVIAGNPEALPAADWPGRSVYHLELSGGVEGGTRRHIDGYVIQFPQGAAVEATAITGHDPGAYRKQVEAVLKSFQLGTPPKPATSGRR